MENKKTPASKWILLVIAVFAMFATQFITPPSGLSQAGFQILGILVGAIILFLSWGTGWTSMAIVFALLTLPDIQASAVTAATFGNSTVVFLLFCFMIAGALTKSGAAKRIAVWFLTNKLSRKSPWWTVIMYFAANYVLCFVLSTAATIMVMMPIAIEILESCGIKKEDKSNIATALLLGTMVIGLYSNGANPISHAVTLQGFSFYESYTGEAMDFFRYCALATPISILCSVLFYLMVRFIWRPDVKALSNIDYESMTRSVGKMTKREKWSVWLYIFCIIFWMMPGLSKYIWPAATAFFGRINNCMPPLLALFIMNFVKAEDGKPVFAWSDAVKSVSWPTFMFIAAIMGLGAFMGNADIGVSAWLSDTLSPVFENVSPVMFVLIMLILVNILTNLCSNSVSHSVVFAIALPLAMTVYKDSLTPFLVATVITSGAMNGFATPPSSPGTAVVYGSGWVTTGKMVTWGFAAALIHVVIAMVLGFTFGINL